MNLNTIIVEDEPLSRIFLKNLLEEYCPDINIIGYASAEDEAVESINLLKPDLVLMDIELQQGNGFKVLQRTRHCNYNIIFTTALDYTGIRAIRFSAVNYLQKPIDIEHLQAAVQHIVQSKQHNKIAVGHLLQTLDNNHQPSTVFLNTLNGPAFVELSSILYIKLQHPGCLFFTEKETITVNNCNLKEFELMLNDLGFFRPHSDYIVQLEKVDIHSKNNNGQIRMMNNDIIPVSPKKQEQLDLLLFKLA